MEAKLKKAKLEFSSFCGGLGSMDVAQDLLSLTFRNQVMLKWVGTRTWKYQYTKLLHGKE